MWRSSVIKEKQFRERKHQELEVGQVKAESTNLLAIVPQFP